MPTNADVSNSRPFSGGAGDVLRTMLAANQINIGQCFFTNVVHTTSPTYEFEHFLKKAGQVDLVKGLLQLRQDIIDIKPNLIVALGSGAWRMLTNKQGIDKWRGSVMPCTLVPGHKVLGTYSPGYILKIYDYKAVTTLDLAKVNKEAAYPEIRRPERTFYLNPDDSVLVEQIVNEMLQAEWLSVDIECVQRDDGSWRLSCVGFSDKPDRALVLACDESWRMEYIRRLCESNVPKVAQNGTFDSTVLEQNRIKLNNFRWDTMIAHHALYPECASGGDEMTELAGKKRQSAIGKGLRFLTSFYTDEPYYKDDGKLWHETNDLQMFWRYNALDAAVTREIRDVQEKDIATYGVEQIFQWSMDLVDPLMRATNRGLLVDMDRRAALTKKYETEIANLQAFLNAQAGGPVNVKSTPQILDLLYNRLGLPTQRKRGSGRPTADKDAINALAGKSTNPVLHTILEIRERRDLLERYLQAQVDPDGRFRCSFDLTGTRSRRLASRQSIYGSGTNLQTIPEDLRSIFIADPGKTFVIRDYKQAEAVIVAHLARCKGLIELFDDPTRDVHKENASRIFGIPVSQVTKTQRYLAKRVVHASNYGMEAKRLVEIVNQDAAATGVRINLAQAQDLLNRYFMIYPEIKEHFWGDVRRELNATRTLVSPFGAKRTFFGRYDDKLIRDGYSWKPQCTVGEMGRLAIVRVARQVPECEFLLNVHDSLLVQCDIGREFEVAAKMELAMRIPVEINGRSIVIPTDCKIGRNWGNATDDNPDGLVEYKDAA